MEDEPQRADTEEQAPNTWLNALLGAAVSVLLGFIPFSPVLGGSVAGYLEGGDTADGLRVGAIAGVFAAVPVVLIALALFAFIAIGVTGRAFLLFALVAFVVGTLYSVGLSAIGGALGVYVKEEV